MGASVGPETRSGPLLAARTRTAAWWPMLAVAALWLLTGVLTWRHAAPPGNGTDFSPFSMLDFRDSVWIPIHDFLHGGVPWDKHPYELRHPEAQFYPLYIPSYWWATGWLLVLPYRVAAVLWAGLLVAALVWMVQRSLRLWLPALSARAPWLVLPASLALLVLRPVQTSLSQGNWAILSAAGAFWALTAAPVVGGGARPGLAGQVGLVGSGGAGRTATALRRWCEPGTLGALLAIAKPPVGLPLLLAQVVTRRTRSALQALVVTFVVCLPIGLLVLHRVGGWAHGIVLLRATISDGDGMPPSDSHFTRMDSLGVLDRLLPAHPAWLSLLVLALTLAATMGVGARSFRRHGRLDVRTVSLLSLGVVVCAPNLHYSLVVAVPVLVALAAPLLRALWARRPGTAATGPRLGRELLYPAAAWLLVLLACLSPVRAQPVLGISAQMANQVYGVALLLAVAVLAAWAERSAPAARRPAATTAEPARVTAPARP